MSLCPCLLSSEISENSKHTKTRTRKCEIELQSGPSGSLLAFGTFPQDSVICTFVSGAGEPFHMLKICLLKCKFVFSLVGGLCFCISFFFVRKKKVQNVNSSGAS